MIHRTRNNTIIYGCLYTTARNSSLYRYSFVKHENKTYLISNQTNILGILNDWEVSTQSLFTKEFVGNENSTFDFEPSITIGNITSIPIKELWFDIFSSVNDVFIFPPYVFPYLESGNFSCVISIGEETFTSNASKLYTQPGWYFSVSIIIPQFKWVNSSP